MKSKEPIRISVILISTARSGGQSSLRILGRQNSSSILPIVLNEVPIFGSKDIACAFNEYVVLHLNSLLQIKCHSPCYPALSYTAIFIQYASEEQVLELMKGVDISNACGMVIRLWG